MVGKNIYIEIGSFITNGSTKPIKTRIYMEEKNLMKNEVKKDLYKSKNNATFAHYVSGNMYYNVEVLGGIYQFPIAVVESYHNSYAEGDGPVDSPLKLSEDLGTTTFSNEMKGSELNRWISKAIDKNEFIKIG